MKEEFYIGQKVVFRKDWLAEWIINNGDEHNAYNDAELEEWVQRPYMTVGEVSEHDPSVCNLDVDIEGSWTYEAITAYIEPIKIELPEDLFTL